MSAQAALYGGMAAYQIVGGYYASQNIKDTAELNRDIADMNAEFARLDAYDTELEGETQKAQYQSIIDATVAQQDAIMRAQDIDVNYGSAASIGLESKFLAELNKMEIEKQFQQQALGYSRQARDYKISGALQYGDSMQRASQVMINSVSNAASTGLTGYERSK
jgi:hypothetical protein